MPKHYIEIWHERPFSLQLARDILHHLVNDELRVTAYVEAEKMVSHAIFQYSALAIDDTHNTWTYICVKMIIIRLIGPRDEKIQNPEEIRSKGQRQR